MSDPFDHSQALYDAQEPPEHESPEMMGLVIVNADAYCERCRLDGEPYEVAEIPASSWAVLIADGGYYHVECARSAGWVPSANAAGLLERWPDGPYA